MKRALGEPRPTMVAGCGATPEPGVVEKVVTKWWSFRRGYEGCGGPPVVQTVVETQRSRSHLYTRTHARTGAGLPIHRRYAGARYRCISKNGNSADQTLHDDAGTGAYTRPWLPEPEDGSWYQGWLSPGERSVTAWPGPSTCVRASRLTTGPLSMRMQSNFYVDKSKEPAFLFRLVIIMTSTRRGGR